MHLLPRLSRCLTRTSARRQTGRRAARGGRRPGLECLEDRVLLTAGALDPTFGSGGLVRTAFAVSSTDQANGVAVQSDGKVIVVGETFQPGFGAFALARYTPAGVLDTNFGTGGLVVTQFPGSTDDGAVSAAVQSDGKIVVAGESLQGGAGGVLEFALARYTSAGVLDSSFGSGGLVLTAFPGSVFENVTGLALQGDGKIVVAGFSNQGSTSAPHEEFALARYTASGALDGTFGSGGLVLTAFPGSSQDVASGVALQSGGDIVVAGSSVQSSGPTEVEVARYTPAGALDSTFGSGGVALTAFPGTTGGDAAAGVAVQSDGGIVVAGTSNRGTPGARHNEFALARFTASGALDGTFGSGGLVLVPFFPGSAKSGDTAAGVAVLSDGKIVVAGHSEQSATDDFALAQLTASGALDGGFAGGGLVVTPFPGTTGAGDFGQALAVQSDGKVVAVGDSGEEFGVARYQDDAPVPQAPAISSGSSTTFTEGSPGTFTVTATGFPAPSLAETGPLPAGVTFTDKGNGTATLAGTPAPGTAGLYTVTLNAHNGVGSDFPQLFLLAVHQAGQAPAITSAGSFTLPMLSPGSFTITTTGSPTPSLTESGFLPVGMTFTDNGNGTATLAGTPMGVVGTYTVTITAHNGIGPDATQTFQFIETVAVAPPLPPPPPPHKKGHHHNKVPHHRPPHHHHKHAAREDRLDLAP